MRVALYARYSSDLQNERSAEDQLAALRQTLAVRGWTEAGAYMDRGISGAALVNRPGIQTLLADAHAGRFDAVLAEDLDRLSRDQEGTAHLYKQMTHAGVAIETMSQGRIGVMHVGLAGTMNQLFLEQLAAKTKRGLEARVRAGFSGGGRCYGYDIADKGVLTINPAEAAVIRRIFTDYAKGHPPRRIAIALNAEGVPAPRGGSWAPSTISGDRRAADGILAQELYIGVRVFNRRRFRKHPDTGRRSSVLNPPEQWIRVEAPELRILEQDLWDRAQGRRGELALVPAARARKPKRLLSGLLWCARCDGPMTLNGGRFECSRRRDRGLCDNNKVIAAATVERRVIEGVRTYLLDPAAIGEAVRTFHAETESARKAAIADRAPLERELAGLDRRLHRAQESYLDEVMELHEFKTVAGPMKARKAEIEALLAGIESEPADPVVRMHPAAADAYRALAETLHDALAAPDGEEAREAFRRMIERVDFHPAEGLGRFDLTVHGQLADLLRMGAPAKTEAQKRENPTARSCGVSVGAGTGFEPVTFRL